MKHIRNLAAALIVGAPLLACSEPPAPPAPPAAPAPPVAMNESPKGFIARQVDKAITEARKELQTQNISFSDGFRINVNGNEIKRNAGLPNAEITPQGELLIEGKTVAITPEQQQQLMAYRSQVIGIAEAGMAIGAQGAGLAGTALSGAAGAIFGGEEGGKALEQQMEAQGKKLEAEAMKLCAYLPAMLSSQQALAASLPAFKPYANMTQADIDDCGKKGKNNGVAVTSS